MTKVNSNKRDNTRISKCWKKEKKDYDELRREIEPFIKRREPATEPLPEEWADSSCIKSEAGGRNRRSRERTCSL